MREMPEDRGDVRPVPDPTSLTTEALHREIFALREFVLAEIKYVREISQAKFAGVERTFAGVAERTLEQKHDTKDALDAALRAAKDAVSLQTEASDKAIAKAEAATTKQIDALAAQFSRTVEALDARINDRKDYANKLELRIGKLETTRATQTDSSARTLAGLAAVVSVLVLVVLIYGQFKSGA